MNNKNKSNLFVEFYKHSFLCGISGLRRVVDENALFRVVTQ